MKKNIIKLALVVVLALLIASIGFAAKGKKRASPSQAKATIVQQDSTPVAPADPAQGEQINWQVISSGGTEATSTNFALKGTVGQTAVGHGSSANYGLSHGFWQECYRLRGDVNHSGAINVADLTYLVDYLFFDGPPPPCMEEGDVDGAGGINVADLTYLVDFLFFGGPPPPPRW